ncbi:MAG: cobalamin B12-binding domain-containing protein [Alphaproteobacteria bacterium]|nr:cobalamin B12-binding domain-containing protein [Alphaproteobacteria bacterium]
MVGTSLIAMRQAVDEDLTEFDDTPPRADDRREEADYLNRTIEAEIIPRLIRAHDGNCLIQEAQDATEKTAALEIGAHDVARFAETLLSDEGDAPLSTLWRLRRRGASLERLYVDLLAPAARLLGEQWSDDRRSFADVTVGLSRLQHMLRALSPAFAADSSDADGEAADDDTVDGTGDRTGGCEAVDSPPRRILLASAPGEQHTFGLFMVEEFFRRAGWEVFSLACATAEELLDVIASQRISVVGLSLSRNDLLDAVASFIDRIRQQSLNSGVSILVGGRVFADSPELVERVGADACVLDARHSVAQAETLIAAAAPA